MPRIVWLAAAAVVGAAAQTSSLSNEGSSWVEVETGFLAAKGVGRLRLETRGKVILRGGGGNQIGYRSRRRVRAASEAKARALLDGGSARIRRTGDGAVLQAGFSPLVTQVEFEVFVPPGLRMAEVFSSLGDILLRDLPLDVWARTGGGRVDTDGVSGRLEVSTAGGDILVGRSGGELRAVSGGGLIHVRRSDSTLWAETVGGEIFIERAGGDIHASTAAGNIHVMSTSGSVDARTAGGLIKVDEAHGPVRADSGGGIIQVASARGVRCESMGGPIRLTGVTGELFAATIRGSIFADLLAGRVLADSILSADSGDITVLIPSNLAVTVEAVSDSIQAGHIITEFPQIRVRPNESSGRAVASGKLNGGGPLLKVAASRGSVFLKRK